jgi:hypothetical protein
MEFKCLTGQSILYPGFSFQPTRTGPCEAFRVLLAPMSGLCFSLPWSPFGCASSLLGPPLPHKIRVHVYSLMSITSVWWITPASKAMCTITSRKAWWARSGATCPNSCSAYWSCSIRSLFRMWEQDSAHRFHFSVMLLTSREKEGIEPQRHRGRIAED